MVSVIVPVFNAERHLAACIRSILAQTYGNLEILLVDDGSTDASGRICRAFAQADSRIRLFSQENRGVSAARNRALAQARGTWVTFVDADDLLPPKAVEILRKSADMGADFVIGAHETFRGPFPGKIIRRDPKRIDSLVSLMCGKLYRRSLIAENGISFPVGIPYGEDTVFNLRYRKCAGHTTVLQEVVYRCRLGGMASSVRYYPNRDELAAHLLEAYCAYFGGMEQVPAALLCRLVQTEWEATARHYLAHCRRKEAWEKASQAQRHFRPLLPDCFLEGRETAAIREIARKFWLRILLKKWKLRYCTRRKP